MMHEVLRTGSVAVLLLACLAPGRSAFARDLTGQVEVLPDPLPAPAGADNLFARNVWDLQTFRNRLYVATGGPRPIVAATAAPAPASLRAIDAARGRLVGLHAVDAWIGRFRLEGDVLYAIGRGASGGALHRLRGTAWTSPSAPAAGPVYDVVRFRQRLFAAAATPTGGAVLRSRDRGRTWKPVLEIKGAQPRTFLVMARELYVSTSKGQLFGYTGGGFERLDAGLFPGVPESAGAVVATRSTIFRREAVYLGGRTVADPSWAPVGLFAASSLDNVRGLILPRMAVRDLRVRGSTLYVLASSSQAPEEFRSPRDAKIETAAPAKAPLALPGAPETWVWVLATKNLVVWEEVLAFRAPTFARSFELLKGDFYFGLGCEADRPSPACGRILRIRAKDWKAPPEAWIY